MSWPQECANCGMPWGPGKSHTCDASRVVHHQAVVRGMANFQCGTQDGQRNAFQVDPHADCKAKLAKAIDALKFYEKQEKLMAYDDGERWTTYLSIHEYDGKPVARECLKELEDENE